MTNYRQYFLANLTLYICIGMLAACGGGGGGGNSGNQSAQATPCTDAAVSDLQLTSVSPSNGASNVSVHTSISATFNTCVNMSTIDTNTFAVSNGGLPIAGSYVLDGENYTVVFTPSSDLVYDSAYVVAISNTITGSNGESFAGGGWGFFTRATPDTTPPVTSFDVPEGYYNSTQTVTLSCDDGATGTGCANTYYTTNGNTPTTSSSVYSIPVEIADTTTLKFFSTDVEGNAETVQTVNYVIDKVPPTVTGTDPADTASGVMLTASLSAVFDEPILQSTLTDANFYVDNGVTGTISYDDVTDTVTFTPFERLACNTTHTATLTTAVTDLAGNALENDYTWAFTTTTDCAEPVTTASLAGGVFTTSQSVTLTCDDSAGSGCARIVYTTDGSTPSVSPANGTVVEAASAGPISINVGDTLLRYFAEDNAGNREVERKQQYSVSTNGFTFAATSDGISRGAGPSPTSFVNTHSPGNTLSFFTDASNGRFYRGTERGVYFSDDDGASWQQFDVIANASYHYVEDIFAAGSKIYAGTHDGLYVSVDGGASFTKRFPLSGSFYDWIYEVQVHGYRVYAGTSDGLLISSDKGYSFEPRTTADGLGSNYVYDLHADGSTIYAATGGGLSISTDGGQTFTNRTTVEGLGSNTVNVVLVDGTTVYAGTDGGLSISTDSGASFTNYTTTNGMYSNNVTDLHLDGVYLYAATGTGLSVFDTGNTTFTTHQPAAWSTFGVTVEAVHTQAGNIYLGAYPSFYQSTDNGATWEQQGLPASASPVEHIAAAADGTLYFHVSNSSGFSAIAITTDKGETYTIKNIGEVLGSSAYIDNIYVDNNTLYVATTGIAVSSDGGANFTVLTATDNNLSGNSANAVYADGTNIYAITGSSFLDESTNGGTSFTAIESSMGTHAIAVDGGNVYIAGSSGLDVSNNNWATFTRKTTADGLPANYLEDVAVHSSGNVYVTTLNNGVAVSADSGASFTAINTLPNSYTGNWVSTCGGPLYVSTASSGLFISQDNAATFVNRTASDGLGSDNVMDACYVP
ncbi:MAG: Ig-like domain-containing protein [Gammaproteobacteria bacterium]|jgi:photosystem II stability/assembly factor-like uncharacterized protein